VSRRGHDRFVVRAVDSPLAPLSSALQQKCGTVETGGHLVLSVFRYGKCMELMDAPPLVSLKLGV